MGAVPRAVSGDKFWQDSVYRGLEKKLGPRLPTRSSGKVRQDKARRCCWDR